GHPGCAGSQSCGRLTPPQAVLSAESDGVRRDVPTESRRPAVGAAAAQFVVTAAPGADLTVRSSSQKEPTWPLQSSSTPSARPGESATGNSPDGTRPTW